jgi:hypothetical protein
LGRSRKAGGVMAKRAKPAKQPANEWVDFLTFIDSQRKIYVVMCDPADYRAALTEGTKS